MKLGQYQELEKNKTFKRKYLGKTIWWTNYSFIPPALILFVGLAGLIHMSYNGLTGTWQVIPYIIVFAVGAIWFKGVKTHVQKKILEDKESFLVCAAKSVGNQFGRYYFVFSKDSKRHNENFINKYVQDLSISSFTEEELAKAKKQALPISSSEQETSLYLVGIPINRVKKSNTEKLGEGITPLLYISEKDIFVIRRKDLKK